MLLQKKPQFGYALTPAANMLALKAFLSPFCRALRHGKYAYAKIKNL